MTGDAAVSLLHTYHRVGAVPGLNRVRALLDKLGRPEDSFSCIHVVGTNGKGSTCAMLASVLQAAGLRTGLFTSPYLWRFHERIRVDGVELSDAELAAVTAHVTALADTLEDRPTEFEVVTCLALEYFRKTGCTLVVLEAGMGGRRDATNAIPPPEVAVMTSIGLDHTPFLGQNEVEIALEKGAVIKPGCEAVLCGQSAEVEAAVSALCTRRGVPLTIADGASVVLHQDSREGQRFSYHAQTGPFHDLFLPLLGAHQRKNAAVALETIATLRRRGWAIPDEAVHRGLANVSWPGRFEVLCRTPWLVVDGGHNPQCAAAVAAGLDAYFPGRSVVFLLGMMADKDSARILAAVAGRASAFVAVAPEQSRALPAEALARLLHPYGRPVATCVTVEQGVAQALALAGRDGVVCAMGSLYMTGAVRRCFGR